ncbi:MAG: VCBS repeat-containing protein [Anaerolineae bacterium]|nr:VCBS repeat-containing protein [Thermoflexales bacterium]MDW8407486.1 VCBS repeat-containing protein [Anaerolineae bacterium]
MKRIDSPKQRSLRRSILVIALAVAVNLSLCIPHPLHAGPRVPGVGVWIGGTRVMRSSPAVVDFNGDGMKEIVIGTYDGRLVIVGWSGGQWQKLWERQTALEINAANPPALQSQSRIESPIVVADLDQNGTLEIVVTTGGLPAHCINGGTLVYTYLSPWQFALFGNWPQPKLDEVGGGPNWGAPDGCWDGIFSGAAVGDIDGDGDLEIVWEGEDRRIHAYHHNGSVVNGWPLYRWAPHFDPLSRGGISSPALGDIDGDGLLEIVVGGTSPRCYFWNGDACGIPDYSVAPVWAINGDSTLVPGWPKYVPQLVDSSPALGDLDGNGQLDIIVGTGRNQIPGNDGKFVYAWRGDGTPLAGWPQPLSKSAQGSPALADLDGNGGLDVAIGCGDMDDPACYDLYAWRGNGVLLSGFPMQPPTTHVSPSLLSTALSPIVADLDGNGELDILMAGHNSPGVTVIRANGQPDADMSRVQHSPLDGLYAPPTVADVDNDGLLETIVVGESNGNAALYLWDEIGPASPAAMPWPMHRHDNRRTGNYCFTEAPPSNPTLFSTSVPTNTWTAQGAITVWWSGAGVGGPCPGLPSYSMIWTNSPTSIPDTIVDTASTSSTSPTLSDGVWWFHLRTRDSWSNWSTNVIHIGPFFVDKTPPNLPFASVTTPTVNTWSNSSRITVSISPALDSGSGLSGYSVVWDQSPSTLPGATQNSGAVTSLSHGPLSGASSWYLHVRSVDQVGNWSADAAHFGPFRIDREPPHLPSASGSHPAVNIWTASTSLQVNLTAGGDIGSGLNGYSFIWDNIPTTTPDTTPDSGPVSSLSTAVGPSVADWYVHVRSVDNAGNASVNTLHYGPFKVDRVPPGAASVAGAQPATMTWSNAGIITVTLNPAPDPGSGLDGYSLVWDSAPSTQPDSTRDISSVTSISLSTTANTVMSWYLHLRALDAVGNVATSTLHYGPFLIDRVPPQAGVAAPATLNSSQIPIFWWGSDFGSGVAAYDIQARLLPTTWMTWLSNVPSTTLSAVYAPPAAQCGQVYEFRARARDAAGNIQAGWSPTMSTLLISSHAITGLVVNNMGQPIQGTRVQGESACAALASNLSGHSFTYFGVPAAYSLTATHSHFGWLPPLLNRPTNDRTVLIVLPPQNNVLINSHFESDAGWTFFGNAGYTQVAHSGFGGAAITGTGIISQRVTLPAQGVLSLLAQVTNNSAGDTASVRVQLDGSLLPLRHWVDLPLEASLLDGKPAAIYSRNQENTGPLEEWRHVQLDLRPAGGLSVSVIIEAVDAPPLGLRIVVDEMTLGSPSYGIRSLYLPLVRR